MARAKSIKRLAILLAILCILAVFMMQGCGTAVKSNEPLLVQYFYFNVCGACDKESEFLDQFEKFTGISRNTPNLNIKMYNVYLEMNQNFFRKALDDAHVDESLRKPPVLIIGDRIVTSEYIDEALKDNKIALNLPDADSVVPVNASVVIVFYAPGCETCEKVEKEIIENLPVSVNVANATSHVQVFRISIADQNGISQFKSYCEAYKITEQQQKTPVAFVGYHSLLGYTEILRLPMLIQQGEGLKTPLSYLKSTSQENTLNRYEWTGIFLTGLINGLNPCAISMVLLLLSLLAVKKEWVLPIGLAFSFGKFLGFLLLGTLLYNMIGKLNLANYQVAFKIVIVVFAILMIILNINDIIAAKRENYQNIRLQLPVQLREWNHKLIKWAVSSKIMVVLAASGILLGMLVACGEFLCTGQIYIAVILQIANSHSQLSGQAFLYLVFYSIAFVMPLIALTLLVSRGRMIFSLSDFFRKNMPWVKTLNVLIFVVVLIIVLI
jgi:cytochrome c biogenesis protein CcdA/thiol-disulfide isomerase/thioredoxin